LDYQVFRKYFLIAIDDAKNKRVLGLAMSQKSLRLVGMTIPLENNLSLISAYLKQQLAHYVP